MRFARSTSMVSARSRARGLESAISCLRAFSFWRILDFFSGDGSHLLFRIRLTASGLTLNLSARTAVLKVALSTLCSCFIPSMASLEIFLGGFQPSGNLLVIASRCAE